LASATGCSPFEMAVALERNLGSEIDLDWSCPGDLWKASGAWRVGCYSNLRFHFSSSSSIMADVFVSKDYLYFSDDSDLIKIGRSHNPRERLGSLQTASGRRLDILLVLPNGKQEREFHWRFRDYWVRGEWFSKSPELLAFIKAERAKLAGDATDTPSTEGKAS